VTLHYEAKCVSVTKNHSVLRFKSHNNTFSATKQHLCHAAATGTIAHANEVPVLSFSEVYLFVFSTYGGTCLVYIVDNIYKTVV
jgi:hypothetical protein